VLGYAKIAGTPIITGIYTMLLPMLLYGIFGGSRHLVVRSDRRRGRDSRNFAGVFQNEAGWMGCEFPKRSNSLLQKTTYDLSGGQPDHGFYLGRRRMEELDLSVDWSGYTTGYKTSAEYPSIRAHCRAGPSIE
jgi:hypothetical protein